MLATFTSVKAMSTVAMVALGLLMASCTIEREISGTAAKQIQSAFDLPEDDMPPTLASTKLFVDGNPTKPRAGLQEFEVGAPLWTDGAHKTRYVFMPTYERAYFDGNQTQFPVGTVFAKHFNGVNEEPVETRIMVLKSDGIWRFATYVWQADGSATLNNDPITVATENGTEFRIPSNKECKQCHNQEAHPVPVFGFNPDRLKLETGAALNQLEILVKAGVFANDDETVTSVTAVPDPADTQLPLNTRVRSYMESNCAMCHRPGGAAEESTIDLRFTTPLAETGLLEESNVVFGDLENSVLWQKFTAPVERMPPLSKRQDPLGYQLFQAWILSGPEG